MNLKYATLGLISGYLAGYVFDYLQNKNATVSFSFSNSEQNEENLDTNK